MCTAMKEKHICILLLILFCSIIVSIVNVEAFGSKKEKTNAIYQYFMGNNDTSYAKYRAAMDGKSNIVDYETARSLINKPNFFEKMEANI